MTPSGNTVAMLTASDRAPLDGACNAPPRRYVVALPSNLGYRYGDERFATSPALPCFGVGVCYTEKIAQLGNRIDDLLRGRRLLVQDVRARLGGPIARRTGDARRRAMKRTGGRAAGAGAL